MNQEPMKEDTDGETVAQKPKQEMHILAIISLALGILGLLMLLSSGVPFPGSE